MEKIILPDFDHDFTHRQGDGSSINTTMLILHIATIGFAIYSIGSMINRYRNRKKNPAIQLNTSNL